MGSGSKDGEEAQHHTDTATTSSRRVIPRWLLVADGPHIGQLDVDARPGRWRDRQPDHFRAIFLGG